MESRQSALAHNLIGTWNLDSYTSIMADGLETNNFGFAALGQAMFDSSGNFSIVVVRGDLPLFASNNREAGTADENSAVVRGSMAYFGTYALEKGESLRFDILGATMPNWIGTLQKRLVVMDSHDRLKLINPRGSAGGKAIVSWTRKI